MDHVLGDQSDFHRTARRHMECIDLALPAGVLKLPHPLLGHSVNFERVSGWALKLEIKNGAPNEDHHGDAKRNHCPYDLKQRGAVDLLRLPLRGFAITDDEEEDEPRNEQG